MLTCPHIRAAAVLLVTCGVVPAHASSPCSPVLSWNQAALNATMTAGQGALPQIRSMAIVQTAVHDAVNGVTREYARYREGAAPQPGATPEAAAIGAAHYALTHLFTSQISTFNTLLGTTSADCGIAADDPGLEFGHAAAAAILTLRAVDGAAQASFPYSAPGAGLPCVWVPEGPAPIVAPGWGHVVPWVLRSGSQFRPDAPDAIDSDRYTMNFEEVKSLGALTGSTRTDEQTQIALFWIASPIWNGVARQVIAAKGLDISSAARTLALMYVSGADASIACFDAKYTYNFWRPITAIHRADEDGNDATTLDPSWQPLITTHQHPEYPSGHTTNSSAMANALRLLFGDDPGMVLSVTSPANVGFVRTWTTFTEGVREVQDARVYIGFHFRNSSVVGARVGRQVAQFVFTHALQ